MDVAGRQINVRADGPADAPVLLLVHGFSGSLRWFDAVATRLIDRFRVVRLDLLGHGATGGAAADAPEQARMVEHLLAHLDLADVTAVGHSFGADVVAELAASARVSRVVVLAQAPDYSEATLPRGRVIMTVPRVARVLHRGAVPVITALGRLAALRNSTAAALAGQAAADFRALDPDMFRIVLVERRERMARRPLDEQLRSAGKPALVVLGGKDHFYGARSADRYRRAGARVEVLAESGHSVIIEFPDETAALLGAFAIAPA
jgi:pimeloyl-ACP methyl ester carboxylesterase